MATAEIRSRAFAVCWRRRRRQLKRVGVQYAQFSAVRNECERNEHDCAPSARCVDTEESFICQCSVGWLDTSEEPQTHAGRSCVQLTNECAIGAHSCSPNAECIDLPDVNETNKKKTLGKFANFRLYLQKYSCKCRPGYDDFSAAGQQEAGRDCRRTQDVCKLPGVTDCSADATW